jgi:APA family basic amino acid/polyamine antiporter
VTAGIVGGSRDLARSLRLRELILIVVGTVIGSGIFIVPGAVLRQTGFEAGPALLVWLVGGGLSLVGALAYGELGAMVPEAGGLYVYLRDTFGRLPAFLYGWTLFFAISSGSLATLAVAAANYLDQIVPLPGPWRKVVSVALVVVVGAINVRGTRQGAAVQNWATGIKVGAIAVMAAVLIGGGTQMRDPDWSWWPGAVDGSLLSGMGVAMIGVLWAYEGWQYVTFSAGEAADPQRTFPRGIVVGTAVLIAVYLLANLAYLVALGPRAAGASDAVAADAVRAVIGPGAGKVIAGAIVVSMFGAANGLSLTAPRVYFAMARDRLFFRRLADVHPRFGTPALAVAASSGWAALLALSGTFEQLLTYVVFAGWIFYALGALSLLVYRRREPERPRPFRVPGYPVTPLVFVAAAGAIVVNTLVARPVQGMLGLGIVLLGVPAYYLWARPIRKSSAPQR